MARYLQARRAREYCRTYNCFQDDGDLSIQQGDIVEIVEETNAEWWTGKLNGRQGIFPASYVEKVAASAGAAPADGKPVYKPFRAALHGTDQPPPAEGATNSVGLQQAPGQAEKKGKYGNLKNTVRGISLTQKHLIIRYRWLTRLLVALASVQVCFTAFFSYATRS